jgi:tungstate transport system substrate-binding protein
LAPAPPWYLSNAGSANLIQRARQESAYALVEHGAWAAHGGAPLAVLVQGDTAMRAPVHVMRGFRANHPAAKLFSAWVTGPEGRRIVGAQRGYRASSP